MQHNSPGQSRPSEQSIAWRMLLESPTVRLFESIGVPRWLRSGGFERSDPGPLGTETHEAYFRRRSGEERLAARKAESQSACKSHAALADLYQRVADALKAPSVGRSRRVERREAQLDDALDDTFPASDPVAIVIPDRRERFQ